MSPLTIPNTFVAQTKAKASQVNANFAAVAAKFSTGAGGILDADCSTAMDLDANKLSSIAGKRITFTKFEVGAVDSAALKKDATGGSPNAAVNDPTHIKDRMIPKTKLSVTAGQKVSATELDLIVEEVAFSLAGWSFSPGIAFVSVRRVLSGSKYIAQVSAHGSTGGQSDGPVTPTQDILVADRYLIGLVVAIGAPGSNLTGTVTFVSIAKS